MIEIFVYLKKEQKLQPIKAVDLDQYLGQRHCLVWIDFNQPTFEEKNFLKHKFHFHPVCLRDCTCEKYFPKISEYKDYLFISVQSIKMKEEVESLRTINFSSFISSDYLVTYHEMPLHSIDKIKKKLSEDITLLSHDIEYFYMNILEEIVERYTALLENINKKIEMLENQLFEDSREHPIDDILTQKKLLIRLKKFFFHQEEVIHKLGHHKYKNICEQCVPYFRNVEDYMRRISDLTEMNLDMIRGLLDASFSLSSNRLGDAMRVLTVFASILLPLGVIAGIFGMNFKNIPGLNTSWGFPIVMLFMATVAAALLIYFKKSKWL
ncbi:MAG: magnesium/cobalt transporter CorA [Deltaproteobacteria bacterium]|nr:magnesium/cobalt transporter CorA [Deltaproteobacteria bacterium]